MRNIAHLPELVRERLSAASSDTVIDNLSDEAMQGAHGTPCLDALLPEGFFESNRQAIAALIIRMFGGRLNAVDSMISRDFLDDAQKIVREKLKSSTRSQT